MSGQLPLPSASALDATPLVWTVVAAPPRVARHCPRCADRTLFVASDRFRVNGQGRRLDVWLLYDCAGCGSTWKRSLHTRALPSEMGREALLGYERNDANLAASHAHDVQALRADGLSVVASEEFEVLGPDIEPAEAPPFHHEVLLRAERAIGIRLDRVLARKLSLSRTALVNAIGLGWVRLPAGARLRTPVTQVERVHICAATVKALGRP